MNNEVQNIAADMMSACASLFVSVFALPPWNETWQHTDAFQRLNDIYYTKNSICLCCYSDDKIVGSLFGVLYKWHSGHQFEIREFFVDTNFQGQGIGKSILSHLENILLTKTPIEIYLLTLSHNSTVSFYESRGYVEKAQHSIWKKQF